MTQATAAEAEALMSKEVKLIEECTAASSKSVESVAVAAAAAEATESVVSALCFPLHYDNAGPPSKRRLTCLFYLSVGWSEMRTAACYNLCRGWARL